MGAFIQVFGGILFIILSLFLTGFLLQKAMGKRSWGVQDAILCIFLSICITILASFLLALLGIFSQKTLLTALLLVALAQYLIIIKNGIAKSKHNPAGSK